MTLVEQITWVDVCSVDDLAPGRGVCALVSGRQVALFRTSPGDELYGLSNYDPFSGAYVLSRGIVGSKGDSPKVASPIYKQTFDLRSGQCLDDPDVTIQTYPVREFDGRIAVGIT